ncbi:MULTISPECIES: ABC transporter substrate-binding protein [unclassified Streptomyces]|uniref:protein kinase domain-containing protein n=1 Tax=unclassified Streptomyces TaxID=2593676 RepID=UPI00093EA98E|nr:ABC transporter substrate-binding protein [Streptomyces sp. TSRI0281]OKI46937.1 serine/threonine protein kinase [Streptomyces sp. TSRI0281]
MRPLTSDDPRVIGEYRTLVRLGAGGMGVVYLARSPGGALAAVKVIRAEHAADPGFRARFRREAEAAARITGPWVVPVTGADTEAREPWLATAFVPGPSLAEMIGTQGALPAATVRALGARLAAALVAVHGAGLVHRDVKPGNVLLALDGPRLIDFGIARHEGATALTATDAVIGTPGYLAPEQASAGPVGPACDVFSLGCVLVYAATGRRPFGEGAAAGVLFRTVHEEPDLRGLPPGLRALAAACLAKDPAARPTADQVHRALADEAHPDQAHPGQARPGQAPPDPSPPDPSPPDPAAEADRWMPAGLPALIAERSARALALPDPETPPAPAASGTGAAPGPSRRRLLTASAAGAVLLAGGGTAAWMARRRGHVNGPSTRTANRPTYRLGLHADLTGPGRATGLAHQRGVQLAVADHNSRTDAAFRLALRTEDDAGDAARARRAADRLAADPRVLAVIGPSADVTAEDVVARYKKARLAMVVVAAGSTTAEFFASPVLCVTRPFDDSLSIGLISYLIHTRPAERIFLIADEDDPRRSWGIRQIFSDAPLAGATPTTRTVAAGQGFGTAARAVVGAKADAVVYAGGSPTRAARCATALTAAGFTGTRVSAGPVLAPAFLKKAGKAAEGWVFAEAYADPLALPAAKKFTAAHRKRYGAPPATWSAEAYDAVGLIAAAAEATSATGAERGGIAQRLFRTRYRGIVRALSFHDTRGVRFDNGIFLYRIVAGRPTFLGPYGEV